jgi:hypothetical protein
MESLVKNMQMTMVGYISDTDVIVIASYTKSVNVGVAAFKSSVRIPLPSVFSAKVLAGGRTHVLNFSQIIRIDHHHRESVDDSESDTISNTTRRIYCPSDLDNQIES